MLTELAQGQAADATGVRGLVEHFDDGRCKLFLTWKVLQFRREHEALFRLGDYVPLRVSGRARIERLRLRSPSEGGTLISIAPRLYLRLLGERDGPPLGSRHPETR